MQDAFHLIVDNQVILVLVRQSKYHRSLKLRKSGSKGNFLKEESEFLSFPENNHYLNNLLNGKVINI